MYCSLTLININLECLVLTHALIDPSAHLYSTSFLGPISHLLPYEIAKIKAGISQHSLHIPWHHFEDLSNSKQGNVCYCVFLNDCHYKPLP